jgi:hypothetical protein
MAKGSNLVQFILWFFYKSSEIQVCSCFSKGSLRDKMVFVKPFYPSKTYLRCCRQRALYFLKLDNLAIFSLLSFLATSCYHLLLHAELNLVIFIKNRPFVKSVEFLLLVVLIVFSCFFSLYTTYIHAIYLT